MESRIRKDNSKHKKLYIKERAKSNTQSMAASLILKGELKTTYYNAIKIRILLNKVIGIVKQSNENSIKIIQRYLKNKEASIKLSKVVMLLNPDKKNNYVQVSLIKKEFACTRNSICIVRLLSNNLGEKKSGPTVNPSILDVKRKKIERSIREHSKINLYFSEDITTEQVNKISYFLSEIYFLQNGVGLKVNDVLNKKESDA